MYSEYYGRSSKMFCLGAPTTVVTQEEFNLFHSIDRSLYTILVMNLLRDPVESMRLVALFLWLERKGFRNCVVRLLSYPYAVIAQIAEEAEACLSFIDGNDHSFASTSSPGGSSIPTMQAILGQELSPGFFHQERPGACEEIDKINSTICRRALADIMEQAVANKASRDSSIDDRTLFITFSKGYPVQEWEVGDFFTKTYGDCVESVHMQEVQPNEQPLFARIVFRTASIIVGILNGNCRAKFTINGKHAWARKYVPKRSRPQQADADNLPEEFPYII